MSLIYKSDLTRESLRGTMINDWDVNERLSRFRITCRAEAHGDETMCSADPQELELFFQRVASWKITNCTVPLYCTFSSTVHTSLYLLYKTKLQANWSLRKSNSPLIWMLKKQCTIVVQVLFQNWHTLKIISQTSGITKLVERVPLKRQYSTWPLECVSSYESVPCVTKFIAKTNLFTALYKVSRAYILLHDTFRGVYFFISDLFESYWILNLYINESNTSITFLFSSLMSSSRQWETDAQVAYLYIKK